MFEKTMRCPYCASEIKVPYMATIVVCEYCGSQVEVHITALADQMAEGSVQRRMHKDELIAIEEAIRKFVEENSSATAEKLYEQGRQLSINC